MPPRRVWRAWRSRCGSLLLLRLFQPFVEQGACGQQPFAAGRGGVHPEFLGQAKVVVAHLFDKARGAFDQPGQGVERIFTFVGRPARWLFIGRAIPACGRARCDCWRAAPRLLLLGRHPQERRTRETHSVRDYLLAWLASLPAAFPRPVPSVLALQLTRLALGLAPNNDTHDLVVLGAKTILVLFVALHKVKDGAAGRQWHTR